MVETKNYGLGEYGVSALNEEIKRGKGLSEVPNLEMRVSIQSTVSRL